MPDMSTDDIMRAIFLSLIAGSLIASFLVSNRNSLGKTAQMAAIWGLIFVGAIAGYGLWNDISRDLTNRQSVVTEGTISVPRRPDGHYYVTAQVNGVPIEFVIDTGATDIVLGQSDAAAVGLNPADLAYLGSALTANGQVRTASVTLNSINLSGIEDRNVRAVVNEGAMEGSLMGMGYLGRFSNIQITDGQMILTR